MPSPPKPCRQYYCRETRAASSLTNQRHHPCWCLLLGLIVSNRDVAQLTWVIYCPSLPSLQLDIPSREAPDRVQYLGRFNDARARVFTHTFNVRSRHVSDITIYVHHIYICHFGILQLWGKKHNQGDIHLPTQTRTTSRFILNAAQEHQRKAKSDGQFVENIPLLVCLHKIPQPRLASPDGTTRLVPGEAILHLACGKKGDSRYTIPTCRQVPSN